ncbi:calcium homeostasis modulator protein 6 [Diretmus argenteus]
MDKFKTVLSIAKQQSTFGFGAAALLTAGGEQIFSAVVFSCPCNQWNLVYGLVFLLVPAFALLILGFILSKKTWKLLTGACHGKPKPCRPRTFITGVTVFIQIATAASVAPSSWVAVALLNGNYFVCAMTGLNVTAFKSRLCVDTMSQSRCQEELYKFPCGKATPQAEVDDVLATLRALSQIMGWLLIVSIVVVNLLLICVARCRSPISYLQLKFWKAYAQEEHDLMECYSEKHAKELAERNLKSFFQQKTPEPIVTPSNLDWQKISALYRFSTKDHYYSTMHWFVEECLETDTELRRMATVRSYGSDGYIPAVLTFVDEGKISL